MTRSQLIHHARLMWTLGARTAASFLIARAKAHGVQQ